jgi:hypothetical protein
MISKIDNAELKGMNLTNLKGKIESLQLVTTEKKEKIAQMKKDFSGLITPQYQELMRVKDENNRVKFYSDMQGEQIKELIMLAEDDNSFTVIQLIGNFTLKDIQDISE